MTDTSPSTVLGELVTLTITVAAIPDEDAIHVMLPGNGDDGPIHLLAEDLDLAKQAATDAFVAALRGHRTVFSVDSGYLLSIIDLPAPSAVPEPF